MEGRKREAEHEKITRERSKLYDKSCHSSGKRFCVCQLSLERQWRGWPGGYCLSLAGR